MRRKWLPSLFPPVRPKIEGPGWLPARGEIASEGFVLSQWFKGIKSAEDEGKGCEGLWGLLECEAGGLSLLW